MNAYTMTHTTGHSDVQADNYVSTSTPTVKGKLITINENTRY